MNNDRLLGVLVGGIAVYLLLKRRRPLRYLGGGSTLRAQTAIAPAGGACCDDCAKASPLQQTVVAGGLGNFTLGQPAPTVGAIIPTVVPAIYPILISAPPSSSSWLAPYYAEPDPVRDYPLPEGGFDQFGTSGGWIGVPGKGGTVGW